LDLAPRLADISWHLQIHMEGSLIEVMGPALERVPVVIDHIGRIDAGLGLRQAACQHLLHLPEHDRFWAAIALRARDRPMPTPCRWSKIRGGSTKAVHRLDRETKVDRSRQALREVPRLLSWCQMPHADDGFW
jgi:hypothetical protein